MKRRSKKTVLTFGLACIAVALVLFSCTSVNDKKGTTKTNEAVENLNEAKKDLDQAKKEYNEKYEAFKNASNIQIAEIDKSIAELKATLKNSNKSVQADIDKKLTELEQKNQSLKSKLRDFKDESNDKWESFKIEFKHDMDNLGQALKDLTKDNTK